MKSTHVVCWQLKKGGEIHKGYPVSEKIATAWAKMLDKQYPDFVHWVEEVARAEGGE